MVDGARRDDEVERAGDGTSPVWAGQVRLHVLNTVTEARQLLAGSREHGERAIEHDGVGAREVLQQDRVEVARASTQVQVAELLIRVLGDERTQRDELPPTLWRTLFLALQPPLDEVLVVPAVVVGVAGMPVAGFLVWSAHRSDSGAEV